MMAVTLGYVFFENSTLGGGPMDRGDRLPTLYGRDIAKIL
jgi:hypothetical protein